MPIISSGTRQLLNFAMLGNVGQKTLLRILMIEDMLELTHEDITARIPELALVLNESSWDKACELAEYQVNKSQKNGIRILSPLDHDYPVLLRKSQDDPCLLWVQGTLSTNVNSVAIVGSREPTHHGKLITARIANFFVDQGWSVVSGLAQGCDTIAHESTLQCGGHTVAVMAHGLQKVLPAINIKLAERILANGGALVSEFPFGRNAKPHQFVKRDRTQAGLAQGVVMVQSDLKGGSLHATRAALDSQRWVAVPYPTEMDRLAKALKIQANLLIADGAIEEKQKLLMCNPEALSQIVILNGKDDYPMLVDGSMQNIPSLSPYQSPLI